MRYHVGQMRGSYPTDLATHTGRAYFKDLQKAGVAVRDDWPQYARYAQTRGSIYGNVTGLRRGEREVSTSASSADGDADGDRHAYRSTVSEYFDSPADVGEKREFDFAHSAAGPSSAGLSEKAPAGANAGYLSPASPGPSPDPNGTGGFPREQLRTPSPRPGQHALQYPMSPTLRAMYPHDDDYFGGDGGNAAESQVQGGGSRNTLASLARRRNAGNGRRSHDPSQSTTGGGARNAQPFILRSSAISRTDLIASAERIYSRYLMPGADKEVYLPPPLRISDFPLSHSTLPAVTHPDYDREALAQAQIPDLFHRQKEFVYRAMEQDSFPRFLRNKAFGNLTPLAAYARLAFGLLALWAAFATGFAFVLLDTEPKSQRLWVSSASGLAAFKLWADSCTVGRHR